MIEKTTLRRAARARIAALSDESRQAASARICAACRAAAVWIQARRVLLFAPLGDEPDIWPLAAEALAAGKVLCLPRYQAGAAGYEAARVESLERHVRLGAFGIREPVAAADAWPLKQLDLILVPGVAFSFSGQRLGRGKAYYDRLLPQATGVKCGVAFDEQVEPVIPSEPHDAVLDLILTPTRWLRSDRAAG